MKKDISGSEQRKFIRKQKVYTKFIGLTLAFLSPKLEQVEDVTLYTSERLWEKKKWTKILKGCLVSDGQILSCVWCIRH